jgi:hypothetical protein
MKDEISRISGVTHRDFHVDRAKPWNYENYVTTRRVLVDALPSRNQGEGVAAIDRNRTGGVAVGW